jgi:hypothetical protein
MGRVAHPKSPDRDVLDVFELKIPVAELRGRREWHAGRGEAANNTLSTLCVVVLGTNFTWTAPTLLFLAHSNIFFQRYHKYGACKTSGLNASLSEFAVVGMPADEIHGFASERRVRPSLFGFLAVFYFTWYKFLNNF